MKRLFTVAVCAAALMLTACGGSYKDGTYEGRSESREGNEGGYGDGYGVVTLTIKDNTIIACEYKTYQPDGTVKDENYGKQDGEIANTDFYNKAQRPVKACDQYAKELVEKGKLDSVDAVSGATISYDEFREAVKDALRQAK
ncbi:MAG: FMN-binding protein [Oscillospiraceae bacterium]|nr:FMN-binding protein [Oscillospiraceae bacterium]